MSSQSATKRKLEQKDLETNYLANCFLKEGHSLDDIEQEVKGELLEYSNDLASYWYGNGELIACPHDFEDESIVYVIEQIGFEKYITLF